MATVEPAIDLIDSKNELIRKPSPGVKKEDVTISRSTIV